MEERRKRVTSSWRHESPPMTPDRLRSLRERFERFAAEVPRPGFDVFGVAGRSDGWLGSWSSRGDEVSVVYGRTDTPPRVTVETRLPLLSLDSLESALALEWANRREGEFPLPGRLSEPVRFRGELPPAPGADEVEVLVDGVPTPAQRQQVEHLVALRFLATGATVQVAEAAAGDGGDTSAEPHARRSGDAGADRLGAGSSPADAAPDDDAAGRLRAAATEAGTLVVTAVADGWEGDLAFTRGVDLAAAHAARADMLAQLHPEAPSGPAEPAELTGPDGTEPLWAHRMLAEFVSGEAARRREASALNRHAPNPDWTARGQLWRAAERRQRELRDQHEDEAAEAIFLLVNHVVALSDEPWWGEEALRAKAIAEIAFVTATGERRVPSIAAQDEWDRWRRPAAPWRDAWAVWVIGATR